LVTEAGLSPVAALRSWRLPGRLKSSDQRTRALFSRRRSRTVPRRRCSIVTLSSNLETRLSYKQNVNIASAAWEFSVAAITMSWPSRVDADGTSSDPDQTAADQSGAPAVRKTLHDARAARLRRGGEWSSRARERLDCELPSDSYLDAPCVSGRVPIRTGAVLGSPFPAAPSTRSSTAGWETSAS